jgi:hypothetical protein
LLGTKDPVKAKEMLEKMWTPMKNGDHLDYGKDVEEQIWPDVAKKKSAHRELHWKTWDSQQRYLDKYGRYSFNEATYKSLETMARRTALLEEFGCGGSVGNRHPLRTRAADALQLTNSNIPIVNMRWTFNAFQYLIVNNLQEWLNPGYRKRRQEKMKRERGIEFLLGPA